MNLLDLVRRTPVPVPWSEEEKIPWDDPEFSVRMLREHLSQAHDAASRRETVIDAQVDWIHRVVLGGRPSAILDLACGPGLYTARLAALGHRCVGIDFAPAAIDYAREAARASGLDCTYHLGDLRATEFGAGFDLVMLLFGEFNVFRPADARAILRKACAALRAGGLLLLETHTWQAVRDMANEGAAWRAAESGLFSPRPHLRLDESFWDEYQQVAMHRHWVVDAETVAVTRYGACVQAYGDQAYRAMLEECGFDLRGVYPALDGSDRSGDFVAIVASRA